jgi:hypothetical protein
MGGCLGSRSTPGAGLVGSSAKEWLGLDAAPASFQILERRDGAKGITVDVAGMDKYGLMGELEVAFFKKGLFVDVAEWHVRRALFNACFHLSPLRESATSDGGSVSSISITESERDHTPQKNYSGKALKTDEIARRQVTFIHNQRDELRMGFLRLIRHYGGHTCQGETCRSEASSPRSCVAQKDTFWIDLPFTDLDVLQKGEFASAEAFQQHLCQARKELEEEKARALEALTVGTQCSAGSSDMNSSNFIDVLRDADKRAMQNTLLQLPPALRDTVKKATYKIEKSSWGRALPGFHKYMGAGILRDSPAGRGEEAPSGLRRQVSAAPKVQFTTFFVEDQVATAKSSYRSLTSLMARQYAEFINSIDVNSGIFIVEKVFLNNVCPEGQKIGAEATAEQLWAPVWESGAVGRGELLPVDKIKEIKLSDVVNWNTYCVLCTARGMDFGEAFNTSVAQELKASKLTQEQCMSSPLVEVFMHTNLGRFLKHVLAFWRSWTEVCLECVSAEMSFREEDFEIIAGEARNVMDVVVNVRVISKPTSERDGSPAEGGVPPAGI